MKDSPFLENSNVKDYEGKLKVTMIVHSPPKFTKRLKDLKDLKDFQRDRQVHITRKCIKMYILRYLIAFRILHVFLYCKKVKEFKRFCVSKCTMGSPWGILQSFHDHVLVLIYIYKISFSNPSVILQNSSESFTLLESSNRRYSD